MTTSTAALRWQWANELEAPPEPPWLWRGYVARGAITLVVGKPKAGKSTLACGLTEAMSAGSSTFLDAPVTSAIVVYVSEEGAGTLAPKLRGRVRVLTRDAASPRPTWSQLVKAAVDEAKEVGADLLVIDSFAFWTSLGVGLENDAAVMQQTIGALTAATSAGLAVLLVHHSRKSGGEDGDAVRGSGAIFAAVDMLIEIERPATGAATHRQLVATGRWPDAPSVLVVDFDQTTGGWRVIGQASGRDEAGDLGLRERLLSAVPATEPGATEVEILDLVGLDKRKVGPALRALVNGDKVGRSGGGHRGDPYRYFRSSEKVSAESVPAPGQKRDSVSVRPLRGTETNRVSVSVPGTPGTETRRLTDDELQTLIDASSFNGEVA